MPSKASRRGFSFASTLAFASAFFEAFASARYGQKNGEFRFGVSRLDLGGYTFSRAPAVADFGLALRVSI